MPLRRTQRSDGQKRPRWKDGSHDPVESTHANESRCDRVARELDLQTESLVDTPQLLERSHEHGVSTRDRTRPIPRSVFSTIGFTRQNPRARRAPSVRLRDRWSEAPRSNARSSTTVTRVSASASTRTCRLRQASNLVSDRAVFKALTCRGKKPEFAAITKSSMNTCRVFVRTGDSTPNRPR